MAKISDREKQAHYRQKIAKEYKSRIDELTNKNRSLSNNVVELTNENKELKKEVSRLTERLSTIETKHRISEGRLNNIVNESVSDEELKIMLSRVFKYLY